MADETVEAELIDTDSSESNQTMAVRIASLYPLGKSNDAIPANMIRAVWLSTIVFTIPFLAALPLLNPEPEKEVQDWYADWATQSWSTEVGQTVSSGSRVEAMVTIDQGGILVANYSVENQGGTFAGADCQPQWLAELRAPDPVNYSDGSNGTSWSAENWEGTDSVVIDTPVPEMEASSSDELQEAIFNLKSDTQVWMYGRGEWILSVTNQGSEGVACLGSTQQVTFVVNLTISQWREPRFADGDFNFTSSTVGGGTPVGTFVALGGSVPLLLIAAAVTIGLKKSDNSPSEEQVDTGENTTED